MADEEAQLEVRDAPGESRYELLRNGEVAGFVTYKAHSDRVALIHTEVDAAYEGQGLASVLVRGVLDDLRARGLAVLPFCPYVKEWLTRHPDYVELVPEARRADFGL